MREIFPKIISEAQDGFGKERQIVDGIILMHEVVHTIKSNNQEGMLIKLDM